MKNGFVKVDYRRTETANFLPKQYKKGEREEKAKYFMSKIAPVQKSFRSLAAEKGERLAPTWQPDDIGTENFYKSTGTAYLRKTE